MNSRGWLGTGDSNRDDADPGRRRWRLAGMYPPRRATPVESRQTGPHGVGASTTPVSLAMARRPNTTSPTQVGAETTWTAISANGTHLRAEVAGTLWCWGSGANGELGGAAVAFRTSTRPRSGRIPTGCRFRRVGITRVRSRPPTTPRTAGAETSMAKSGRSTSQYRRNQPETRQLTRNLTAWFACSRR